MSNFSSFHSLKVSFESKQTEIKSNAICVALQTSTHFVMRQYRFVDDNVQTKRQTAKKMGKKRKQTEKKCLHKFKVECSLTTRMILLLTDFFCSFVLATRFRYLFVFLFFSLFPSFILHSLPWNCRVIAHALIFCHFKLSVFFCRFAFTLIELVALGTTESGQFPFSHRIDTAFFLLLRLLFQCSLVWRL